MGVPDVSETVRVSLGNDYYLGDWWANAAPGDKDAFEIPAEQRDRWQEAQDAYARMQEEIDDLRSQRYAQQMAERAERAAAEAARDATSAQWRQDREALLVRPWRDVRHLPEPER